MPYTVLGDLSHPTVRTHKQTVAAGTTSDPVIIRAGYRNVSTGVHPAAGAPGGTTGNVQFTISALADVEAGTAKWRNWLHGPIDDEVAQLAIGVTAVRCAAANGNVVWELTV